MTQARDTLVSLDDTPWYHCVNRCVRRAYLCGEDRVTGISYEHRRGWIRDKIKQLAGIFAIDVGAYAVMSNHYHIVMRVDRDRAARWSVDEVLKRWTALFKGTLLVSRYQTDRTALSAAERDKVQELAETYRQRLYDLSWFMRVLNETIARQANAEEGVKGRFWEGRYKCQALLDETAVLAAMAYVDLNPIRAGMAELPETSDYTSVQERIAQLAAPKKRGRPRKDDGSDSRRTPPAEQPIPHASDDGPATAARQSPPEAELMPFDATGATDWAIPFDLEGYLELIDWTGRQWRVGKRGSIPADAARLLQRLRIDAEQFIHLAAGQYRRFGHAVGAPTQLIDFCARRNARYLKGMRMARKLQLSQAA